MQTDFIVIGSGLAGLTSALVFSKYGKVLLVTKDKLSDGATNWAQGGIACAVSGNDSWRKHLKDTLIAGSYHNNKKAVEFLVKEASKAIDWLEKMGVPFEKESGHFKTGREGGHSYSRILHATDFTGKEIEIVLTKKVRNNKNIEIRENTFVKELIVKNKKCIGVEVVGPVSRVSQPRSSIASRNENSLLHNRYSRSQGEARFGTPRSSHPRQDIIHYFSKAIILATGGLGQLYQWTTNPYVSTGDGVALAYRVGAKLADLEFIQFHPTALKHGKSPLFLLSEAIRGEGAHLVKIKNKAEERFMRNYDKRMELAPRDIVARAIFNEQKKGFEVYLDIRHKGKKFLKSRFPNIYKELEKRGFDLAEDLIPVTPAAHFSCGGIATDLYGRTNIKGLFAFGEVAATGVHGANRLASNSLLEAVVFPLRLLKCGFHLRSGSPRGLHPRSRNFASADKPAIISSLASPARNILRLERIKNNLQHLMWKKVGIVRTKKGLKEVLVQIKRWEKDLESLDYPKRELLEVKNMILAAKLITEAAQRRKRSLGTHFMESLVHN